jgi:hypothetical protein
MEFRRMTKKSVTVELNIDELLAPHRGLKGYFDLLERKHEEARSHLGYTPTQVGATTKKEHEEILGDLKRLTKSAGIMMLIAGENYFIGEDLGPDEDIFPPHAIRAALGQAEQAEQTKGALEHYIAIIKSTRRRSDDTP